MYRTPKKDSPIGVTHLNSSCNSYNRPSSKKKRILALVEESPIELTPRGIATKTGINHATVRGIVRRLVRQGKVVQPYKGAYCSKITHGMIFVPLRVHNVILGVDAPWLDFSDDVVEFTGSVKVRTQFGIQRRRITVRISCDEGMDRNAVFFALNRAYDIIQERTGHVVEDVTVKTFEVNRDYHGVRIDGAKCYTVKGFYDVLERIYQKEDDVVRTEHKITKPLTIDQFQELMRGGVSQFNTNQAVFVLSQKVEALTEAQKFTNEKLNEMVPFLRVMAKLFTQNNNNKSGDDRGV